jgi:hypothetical protein
MKSLSRHSLLTTLLATAAMGLLSGCGEAKPKTAPVHGKITFDGQPLTTGNIMFIPDPTGQYSMGYIAADGTYSLTTFVDGDGALLGNHRVMITAVKDNGPESAALPLTPTRYSNDRTSGLTAQVKEQADNVIDFLLTSKPEKKKK